MTSAVLCSFIIAIATTGLKLTRLLVSRVQEIHTSWQLLSTIFLNHLLIRCLLPLVGLGLCLLANSAWIPVAAAALILAGELTGRYLFFVTVVPTNMASDYLLQEAA